MKQIFINNIKIDIVRKRIKNIYLTVYPPAGRVRITAPLHIDEDTIRLFTISKSGWIKQQQRKFEGQKRISPREYKNREAHYFQGKRYLLNIIEADAPHKVTLRDKTYMDFHIRPEISTAKRHKIMKEWYRRELKKIIPEFIKKWEKRMNIKVYEWRIKLMKTKWGSCNIDKKRIWLNLELAKSPIFCTEYVIVHEMVHLLERYHNKKFYYYMDTFLPNWKKLKTELNKSLLNHADWSY